MKRPGDHYGLAMALIVAALLTIPFLVETMSVDTRRLIIKEDGIVETFSAVGYLACMLFLLAKGGLALFRKTWDIQVILLAMGLREMDFDKRFTTMGIFKTRIYLSSAVPVMEKAIVVLVVLMLLYVVFRLVKNHLPALLREVRARETLAGAVITGLAFAVAAKGIDGLPRKLSLLGFVVSQAQIRLAESFEEALELGIPVMFLLAIFLYFSRQRRSSPVTYA